MSLATEKVKVAAAAAVETDDLRLPASNCRLDCQPRLPAPTAGLRLPASTADLLLPTLDCRLPPTSNLADTRMQLVASWAS
jgi:hypothetical protein